MDEFALETWMDWGVDWIVFLQGLPSPLPMVLQSFSLLGSEYFYFLVMPAIFWCWDSSLGTRLGILILASAGLNDVAKLAFGLPRPYWVSTRVLTWVSERTFGLPSGHAQTSLVVFGGLAAHLRRRGFTLLAVALVLGIGLSRLSLGLHFPMDVAAGWILGAAILGIALFFEGPIRRRLSGASLLAQMSAAASVSVLLLILGAAAWSATATRAVPSDWRETARAARPGDPAIDPRNLEGVISRAGAILGFGIGAVGLRAMGGLSPARTAGEGAVRYALGTIGLLVIFLGLRAVFPSGEDFVEQGLRFVRYAAVGGWIAWGAPRIFLALGLGKDGARMDGL